MGAFVGFEGKRGCRDRAGEEDRAYEKCGCVCDKP